MARRGDLPLLTNAELASVGEGPKEECGVFGIYAPGEDVATLTYYGLYSLQHRGQESAGIAVSNGTNIIVHKEMGLVNQVFDPASLAALPGHLAVGHTRYSTTGSSSWHNAQPQYVESDDRAIALGHNGNLVNTAELARTLGVQAKNDSRLMAESLVAESGLTVLEAITKLAPTFRGAFSVVLTDGEKIYAFRDANGVRPLVLGRLPKGGWVVASETCALEIVGATFVREVAPGEAIAVSDGGIESVHWAEPDKNYCLFEWVYLARPDHVQDGRSVAFARREMGRQLFREAPVTDADVVIAVPDSGRDAAAGYAAESGIPFADGLVKNRYVGRTFIEPTQSLREIGIRLKLSPVREIIEGRSLVVVDDSIVRGNTSRQLVAMLRAAGAREVHLRISSPPVKNPCFYGIDFATKAQLIGADMSVDEIAAYVGADSLHYISLEGLMSCTPTEPDDFCRACFDGIYPIPIEDEHAGLAASKFQEPQLPGVR